MNLTFLLPALVLGLTAHAVSDDSTLLWLSITIMLGWWLFERANRVDLKARVRFVDDRVWLGTRRLGLFPPLWGTEVRNKVYQAAFWRDPIATVRPESFESHIGITTTGELLRQPISVRLPHALLVGPTGSGKTQLVRLIASQFDAEVWVVNLTDPYGLAGLPGVTRQLNGVDPTALRDLAGELSERELRPLNSKLMLVVESIDSVAKDKGLAQLLEKVASRGRSLNVMLLATSQTRSAVPGRVWENCANRFFLSLDYSVLNPLESALEGPSLVGNWGLAKLVRGQESLEFRFPLGFEKEKTAPIQTEAVNPLLSRVSSRPQSELS